MKILNKIGAIGAALAIIISSPCFDVKTKAVSYVCGIDTGTNVEKQDYKIRATTIKSYLASCGSGLIRVQALSDNTLWAEYYDLSYNLLSVRQIPVELPVFGGFYSGNDGSYYIVSGAENIAESDSAEVIRITKYDGNWNRIGSDSLYGANTSIPFDAGTVRFAEYGGYLVIRSCHEMYTSSDGLNHQANITVQLDMNRMEITDSCTEVMNIDFGYVSHSFNQFVEIKDNHILSLDHGDAYPRSLIAGRYTSPVTSGKFIDGAKIFNYSEVYDIPDCESMHYNYTGVSVGGFETTDSGCLTAINSVDMSNYNPAGTRNIYVIYTPQSGTGFDHSTVRQITTDGGYNTPQLVKVSGNRFVLMWSKDNTVYYTALDGNGNITGNTYSMEGNLSDCAPIIINGKILWYCYENEDVTFYEISSSDISVNNKISVISGHDYKYIKTTDGLAVFQCIKCGDEKVESVPTAMKVYGKTDFNDPYYYTPVENNLKDDIKLYILLKYTPEMVDNSETEVIVSDESILRYNEAERALIPVGSGEAQVTFRVKYNPEVFETMTITVAHDHIYSEEWIVDEDASCTENGSKSKHCTICDEKSEITEIPMQGHKTGELIVEREANCTETGLTYRICEVCGERTDVTEIPQLEHELEKEIIPPTYYKAGYTLTYCKNCDYSVKSDYTDMDFIATTGKTDAPEPVVTVSSETTVVSESTKPVSSEADDSESTKPVSSVVTTAETTTVTSADVTEEKTEKPVVTEAPVPVVTTKKTTTSFIVTTSKEIVTTPDTDESEDTTLLPPVLVPDDISGINIVYCNSDSLRVDWNKSFTAHGYIIQQYIDNWTDVEIIEDFSKSSYVRFGLAPDTEYRFRICAYIGDERGKYAEFNIRTEVIAPVGVPYVRVDNIEDTTADVSWTPVSGATGYIIACDTNDTDIYTTVGENITTYRLTGLTPGLSMVVTVTPVNSAGEGTHGWCDFTTRYSAPETVGDVTIYALEATGAILAWGIPTDTNGLNGFILENITTGEVRDMGKRNGGVIDNLLPGTTYNFRVCSYTDGGNSEWVYFNITTPSL